MAREVGAQLRIEGTSIRPTEWKIWLGDIDLSLSVMRVTLTMNRWGVPSATVVFRPDSVVVDQRILLDMGVRIEAEKERAEMAAADDGRWAPKGG